MTLDVPVPLFSPVVLAVSTRRRPWVLAGIAGAVLVITAPAAYACPEAAERARERAVAALAVQNFETAAREYIGVTATCPEDAAAWRDAGRTLSAIGDPRRAAYAFERANALAYNVRDPELHFLHGEALYALEHDDQGRREHDQAKVEIGFGPSDRMERLWLARIHVRRENFFEADKMYEWMETQAGQRGDEEASVARAELAIQLHKLGDAKVILRRLLELQPSSVRAREVLAWVYELEGEIEGELELRAALRTAKSADPASHRAYARALERAHRPRAALAEYRQARELGDEDAELIASIVRVAHKAAPELHLAGTTLVDPIAYAYRVQAGASIPLMSRLALSMIGWRDAAYRSGVTDLETTTVGASTAINLAHRSGSTLRLAGAYRQEVTHRPAPGGEVERTRNLVGGEVSAQTTVKRAVIDVRASFRARWNDAALALVEGGDESGAVVHGGYPLLGGRIVLDAAALAREVRLSPDGQMDVPVAFHFGWSAGFDLIAWSDPMRRVRGEVLDERLDRASHLQDALVVKFRHYDAYLEADTRFFDRIALAPRIWTETSSVIWRKALHDDRIGLEARLTVGYDFSRAVSLYGGGASLLVSPWVGGRLALQADSASETTGAVVGRREWFMASYNQDWL